MKKFMRFNHFLQGRFFFGIGVWPIPEYNGFGFSLVIFYYELSWYICPRGFPEESE